MNRPILWITLPFILGIFCGKTSLVYGLLLGLALLRYRPNRYFLFLIGSSFLFGYSSCRLRLAEIDTPISGNYLTALGRVDSFPKLSHGFLRLDVSCDQRLLNSGLEMTLHRKVRVFVPSSTGIQYGDRILFFGEMDRRAHRTPLGGFDPQLFQEVEGLSATVFVPKESDCLVLSSRCGNRFWYWIGSFKEWFLDRIENQIPYPENSVLMALLLGDQSQIPLEVKDDFVKNGTAHLLAVSGIKSAILALLSLALWPLFPIPRRVLIFLTLILLIFYSFLTGNGAGVWRANIMITLALLSPWFQREVEWTVSLAWSVFLILFFSPLQLWNPGFQFSFVAVTFLGCFSKSLRRKNSHFFVDHLWGSGIVSCVSWFSLIPFTAHYFYLFNPISVLANMALVPYFILIFCSSFITFLFGSWNPFLERIWTAALWFLTKGFIGLSHFFATLPYGFFHVRPPTPLEWIAFYGMFILYLTGWRGKRFLFSVCFLLNIWIWKGLFVRQSSDLKITFLDVGHGDSALIEFPKRGNLLIDTGNRGVWDQGRMTVAPFLWSRGITHLDGVLITHPHLDHYGGLEYIQKEFSIGSIWDDGMRNNFEYERLFRASPLKRAALTYGDHLTGNSDVDISVLHPISDFLRDGTLGPNDESVVLLIRYKDFKLLMMGDAEEKTLERLNGLGIPLKCQVLKVPHHGGNGKEAETQFLSSAKPEVSIVSEAEKNKFHLPSPKTIQSLQRLQSQIYQTGLCGSVECETDGEKFHISTF